MVARAGRKFVSSFLFVATLCAVHATGCDEGGSPGKTGAAGAGTAGTSGGGAGTTGGGAGTIGGGAGTTGGGAGTIGGAAGTTGGAAGTVGAAGTTGGAAGTKGAAGTGAAGTSGGGGAGGGTKPAIARLVQANGNGFEGTGTFTPDAMGFITLTLMIKNCGNTTHGVHLNLNADCSNDGMGSGMHWSPKGDGLPDITCAGGGGGMGMMTFKTPSAGYWTIGTGDAASDILMRSIVVYQGPDTKPGNPIGCGVPRTD